MNKILKIAGICIMFIQSYSHAQVAMHDILPPSPRASAFHIYGTYPVSYSRGLANISIPLYTIDIDGRKFPITLRYHHAGVKFYETEESNVATGWQIDYGGLISLTKLGKRDMDYAFCDHTFLYFTEFLRGDFDTLQKVYHNLNLSSELDGEYDIYNYDFCGKSGRFIYNKEGKVIKFPYNSIDFKFGFTTNNQVQHIDSYDEDGVHYRFGYSMDDNIYYRETSSSESSSLLLTDIETPEGKRIKYIYKNSGGGYRLLPTHFAKVIDNRIGQLSPTDQTLCGAFVQESMTSYNTKIIQEIVFPGGKIVFNSDANGLRISQIDIYNTHGIIKKIKFNTADFESKQKRYALNSLEFKDINNNTESKYVFAYDPGRFPSVEKTNAIDYWGYYNGRSGNTTMVPNFLIPFKYDNGIEFPVQPPVNRQIYASPDNCSRQVDEYLMQAYILKKITYPTGGSTEFTYEANRYGPNNKLGGGLRIKNISNDDGNGARTIKTYKYGNGILELDPETPENYLRLSRNWRQSITSGCNFNTYSYRIRYYGAEMNSTLTLGGGNQIYYREVAEYDGTETENNGRTTYKYDYTSNGYSGYNNDGSFMRYLSSWSNFRGGNLLEKIIEKKKEDGSWDFVSKTTNEYVFIPKENVDGLIVDQILDLPTSYQRLGECSPSPLHGGNYIDYDAFSFFRESNPGLDFLPNKNLFKYYFYTISTGYDNLKSTIETLNATTGQITNKVDYVYDIPDYLQPTRVTSITSTRDTIEKRNKYVLSPEYINTVPYNYMAQKNMISPVLEQKVYKISGNNETLLQTNNTLFKQFYPNIIKPEKSEVYYLSNVNDKSSINYDYDLKGNIIMQQKNNDLKEVYVWGYGRQYPVAKVINSDYATVSSFVNQTLLDNPLSTDAQMRTELNKIRVGLASAKALVTTFTYEPLVGITSQTDANEKSVYYEYDEFKRLKLIRDQDNNIIRKICYNYAGQQESCFGVITYRNVVKSGVYTRFGCPVGGVGASVVYIVPEGTYTSTVDQATVDQLAQADVENNGQIYANTNGPCIFKNVAISQTFSRNNCAIGGVGGAYIYSVAAGVYTSTVSQADADQQAQNEVINNAQVRANTIAFCSFKNTVKSRVGVRNNCPQGSYPNTVLYTVPAGAYTSTIDQAAADQLAENDVNANYQVYANTHGTCISPPCSFVMASGYATSSINSINSSAGAAAFTLTFYSTSAVMSSNVSYTIATINGVCRPSGQRSFTTSGWQVNIGTDGQMTVRSLTGNVPVSSPRYISGSYSL